MNDTQKYTLLKLTRDLVRCSYTGFGAHFPDIYRSCTDASPSETIGWDDNEHTFS